VEPETLLKAWVRPVWDEVVEHRDMLDLLRGIHANPEVPGCCDSGLGCCEAVELWATVAEAGLCGRWPGLAEVADELRANLNELNGRRPRAENGAMVPAIRGAEISHNNRD
jgi:hypothetical protein